MAQGEEGERKAPAAVDAGPGRPFDWCAAYMGPWECERNRIRRVNGDLGFLRERCRRTRMLMWGRE